MRSCRTVITLNGAMCLLYKIQPLLVPRSTSVLFDFCNRMDQGSNYSGKRKWVAFLPEFYHFSWGRRFHIDSVASLTTRCMRIKVGKTTTSQFHRFLPFFQIVSFIECSYSLLKVCLQAEAFSASSDWSREKSNNTAIANITVRVVSSGDSSIESFMKNSNPFVDAEIGQSASTDQST